MHSLYVAHDEFWNLHPTTRSINSSKSNHLPDWKTYFPQLARLWLSQAIFHIPAKFFCIFIIIRYCQIHYYPSKSNHLPDWKTYFPQLARLEYFSYEMIWKYDVVRDEFEKCAKEHLNDDTVRRKIYQEGQDFISFLTTVDASCRRMQIPKFIMCHIRPWNKMINRNVFI